MKAATGEKTVIGHLALLAASVTSAAPDPEKIAVNYRVVAPAQVTVPVSDAVRAATWDELRDKPSAPVTVRLACVVLRYSGGPGRCLPAGRVPADQQRIDWDGLLRQAAAENAARPAAEVELERIAEKRIDQMRLAPDRSSNELFIINFFELAIGPADAIPAPATDEPLALAQVSFARPLAQNLFQLLFPPVAMRTNISAKVTIICRVQPSLALLCRDPGSIQPIPAGAFDQANSINEDFRFATYQLLSTIRLNPKSKAGEDVAGRNVAFTITWAM